MATDQHLPSHRSSKSPRRMPDQLNIGKLHAGTLIHPIVQYNEYANAFPDERSVMGYRLPSWQRGLVWSRDQQIRFVESAWLGIPLGTWTYNIVPDGTNHPFDFLLIDGQQRLTALQTYLEDGFAVFGYRWSETTTIDQRLFRQNTKFPCYITETTDKNYLREYYNLLNFGGTAHLKHQRA